MKLEIKRPDGPATDKATVKISGGSAKLWESATKGTAVPLVNGAAEFTVGSLPKTIYLEATATSSALRDISVEMDYKGNKDTVKATGVWAEVVASEFTTKTATDVLADPKWSNMPDTPRQLLISLGNTGLRPIDGSAIWGVHNVILIKFAVKPAGVGNERAVSFDVTRQKSASIWEKKTFESPWTLSPPAYTFPVSDEEVNDDNPKNLSDESNPVDANGHLYVIDGPGVGNLDSFGSALLLWRSTFREFVRVRFDGTRPSGSMSGSRCADKYKWHCLHYLESINGSWRRTLNTESNVIALGEIDAATIP